MGLYFFIVSSIFLALSLVDRKHDKVRNLEDNIAALNEEFQVGETGGVFAAATDASKVLGQMQQLQRYLELYSSDCSELLSGIDSEDERSKYGINALPRPYF